MRLINPCPASDRLSDNRHVNAWISPAGRGLPDMQQSLGRPARSGPASAWQSRALATATWFAFAGRDEPLPDQLSQSHPRPDTAPRAHPWASRAEEQTARTRSWNILEVMESQQASDRVPTSEQVLAAIKKTGFLLERDVHNSLRSHGFHSFVGVPYPDLDSGKSREIDVVGIAFRSTAEHKISVFMHVVVECKNWESPVVAIGGEPTERDRKRIPEEYSSGYDVFGELRSEPYSLYHALHFEDLPHPVQDAPLLAGQLVLMERKGSDWIAKNDSIYDSVALPLVKAQAKYKSVASMGPSLGHDVNFTIGYRRSVLVTSAPIFGVVVGTDGETRVSPLAYCPVYREFESEHLPGRFVFEVVNVKHFDSWLQERVVPHLQGMYLAIEASDIDLSQKIRRPRA
jgi:hypothetical protein